MRVKKHRTRIVLFGVILLSLFAFGQQCARTPLTVFKDTQFSLSSNPFQLNPPSDYGVHRRFVILLDMSHSMVSGPCPQDVDTTGMKFDNLNPALPYDPNKAGLPGIGSKDDHRVDASDCRLDPNLPIRAPTAPFNYPYVTSFGSDYEGDRFEIIRKWITQIVSTSTPQTLLSTKILLYPFSGGSFQTRMVRHCRISMDFIDGSRYQELLNALDCLQGLNWIETQLAQLSSPYRYQNYSMGTSDPGALLIDLHSAIDTDMGRQNQTGLLPQTQYRFMIMSDGMWTPGYVLVGGVKMSHIDYALSVFPQCGGCNPANPGTCTPDCLTLATSMKDTWGAPEDQGLDTLNINLGKIQTLPKYYCGGYLDLDFIDLGKSQGGGLPPQVRHDLLSPNKPSFFDQLIPMIESKGRTVKKWITEDDKTPFDLILNGGTINFKVTNVYVLNTNARMDQNGNVKADSDGDGLTDEEEMRLNALAGTMRYDPTRSRTDGFCLDSIAANPAFHDRCDALAQAQARTCNPNLDTDGDSLNECEEMILGTNPLGFDTDGDTIPDSLEWIYGFNPLKSDANIDTNADGIPNLVNFANGLTGDIGFNLIPRALLPNYALNYLGRGKYADAVFGQVSLEQYQLAIHSIPTVLTHQVYEANQVDLYATCDARAPANRVPASEQLISYTDRLNSNMLLVLARMIDMAAPKRAYWRIYKAPVVVDGTISQPIIDLSQSHQLRAIDLGPGTGH